MILDSDLGVWIHITHEKCVIAFHCTDNAKRKLFLERTWTCSDIINYYKVVLSHCVSVYAVLLLMYIVLSFQRGVWEIDIKIRG